MNNLFTNKSDTAVKPEYSSPKYEKNFSSDSVSRQSGEDYLIWDKDGEEGRQQDI